MARKRIPAIEPIPLGTALFSQLNAMKQSIEIITGQRSDRIKPLSADATLTDVVIKINEIVDLLQG